jgi:hypothetical protein
MITNRPLTPGKQLLDKTGTQSTTENRLQSMVKEKFLSKREEQHRDQPIAGVLLPQTGLVRQLKTL